MKTLVIAGALLIIIGTIGLVYGGITYTKNTETADLGIAEIQVQEKDHLQIHPLLGGVIAGTGLVLLLIGAKRK